MLGYVLAITVLFVLMTLVGHSNQRSVVFEAHEERASVERAPKSAKVESPWCVLVPAYRPAFEHLNRLLKQSAEMADDFHTVRFFSILSDAQELEDFAAQYPRSVSFSSFLNFEDLLRSQKWTDEKTNTLRKLEKEVEIVSPGWAHRRIIQALKKLLALESMYSEHMCTISWVLDSESVPLRRFSFAEQFLEFQRDPHILVTNLSDNSVKRVSRNGGHISLMKFSSRALGIVNSKEESVITYRTVDFWMLFLVDVSHMMQHVAGVHQKPFSYVFIRNPAGVPNYYGNYVRHFPSFGPNITFVPYPSALKNAGFKPSSGTGGEASADFFPPCDGSGPWSEDQILDILRGPLSWVRGWRFDHLPKGGCKNGSMAQTILQQTPSVTWATSNYDYQVKLIS